MGESLVGDNEQWAALPHLRALRRLVGQLTKAAEGASDETAREEAGKPSQAAKVGADPQSATARDDPDPERNDKAAGGAGGKR